MPMCCSTLKSAINSVETSKRSNLKTMSNIAKMTETHRHEPKEYVVAALYKFTPLENFESFRQPLKDTCDSSSVTGTLLLAKEGINGTIAGSREGIDKVLNHIRSIPGLSTLEHKESYTEEQPFLRMKVRLKREIVTMGEPDIDPLASVGTYIDPKDWNELISSPDVILVDTRNDYEVKIGTFKGAQDPNISSFREFPQWTQHNLPSDHNQKIAMFCTGGIRCEKSTAYMKALGYKDIFHLKGGILKYLEEVDPEESLWEGECFVFDRRVSVGHGLKPGPYQLCAICRQPILDKTGNGGGYSTQECDTCAKEATPQQRKRAADRQKQIDLARSRREKHLGPAMKKKPSQGPAM